VIAVAAASNTYCGRQWRSMTSGTTAQQCWRLGSNSVSIDGQNLRPSPSSLYSGQKTILQTHACMLAGPFRAYLQLLPGVGRSLEQEGLARLPGDASTQPRRLHLRDQGNGHDTTARLKAFTKVGCTCESLP
jgi:hypothetical protein